MDEAEKAAADAAAKAAADAAAAEAATKAAEAAAAAGGEGDPSPDTSKTPLMIPPAAMKKLKEAERLRGQREYQAKLDEDAEELGFKDHADMLDSLRKNQRQPAPKPKPEAEEAKPAPQAARGDNKLARRLEEEKRARQKAERSVREAQERNKALEARYALERKFTKAGITDTDYAVNLLEREMATMTPEAAEAFNADEWVGSIKKSKPFLFGEARVVPIDTTGGKQNAETDAGGGTTPPPPAIKRDKDGNVLYPDALAIDPKTGKYVMSAREADDLLRKIVQGAGKGGAPVLS